MKTFVSSLPHRFDRLQQRTRGLRFVMAVLKKFGDDGAGSAAALIAYYGFFSLFPLLLVFVGVLGIVLHHDPSARKSILDSTLSQFPVIGPEIRRNVGKLTGSGLAIGVGLAGSLLGGFGITAAAQNAFDQVWHVPRKRRSSFLHKRLRGIVLLVALGVLQILSTVAAGFVTATSHGVLATIVGVVVAFAINLLLFGTAFRVLTTATVSLRQMLPGIVFAAIGWQLLEHLGGYYLGHVVKKDQETYGTFAIVIGLLTWLHLGAQVVILAIETVTVRVRGLYPRSLFGDPLTPADRRAMTTSAETEERVDEERVDVTFAPAPGPPAPGAEPAAEREPR